MSITATYCFSSSISTSNLKTKSQNTVQTRKHFSVDMVFDWELTQEEDELADSLPSSAAFLEQGAIGGRIARIRMHPTKVPRVVAKEMVSRNRCREAACHRVGG